MLQTPPYILNACCLCGRQTYSRREAFRSSIPDNATEIRLNTMEGSPNQGLTLRQVAGTLMWRRAECQANGFTQRGLQSSTPVVLLQLGVMH